MTCSSTLMLCSLLSLRLEFVLLHYRSYFLFGVSAFKAVLFAFPFFCACLLHMCKVWSDVLTLNAQLSAEIPSLPVGLSVSFFSWTRFNFYHRAAAHQSGPVIPVLCWPSEPHKARSFLCSRWCFLFVASLLFDAHFYDCHTVAASSLN